MRSRGFTCLILGMWLAAGLVLAFITTDNLRSLEDALHQSHPSATLRIQKLGLDDSRMLLRYVIAERNRYYYELWETVQLFLSLLFFFYLLFATREDKVALACALVLVVVVLLQRFLVTPEMVGLGRLMDFVPQFDPSPHRGRFRVLHATYLGMEVFKSMVQLGLAAFFMTRTRRSSRDSGRKLNVVDKADHRHINR